VLKLSSVVSSKQRPGRCDGPNSRPFLIWDALLGMPTEQADNLSELSPLGSAILEALYLGLFITLATETEMVGKEL